MKKLLLIDGHALIFRSYYAFLRRPMVNSKGTDTSILFGFTKTILELLVKERPTHFAVAFDPPAKTFRHEMFPEYKANRSETPEQIKSALEPLIEMMEAISVPVLMKEGFEADDVIGTIALKASQEGFSVYMVTPDKDYGQLVSDSVFQYKPGKNGGEAEILTKDDICKTYDIEDPKQVIDILTIWGDSSDNIPGVRGIGEVSSKKLINKYKSVDNIYNSLGELPEKQRLAFEDAKQHIDLSKKLVTIETNVQIGWNEESLKLETPDFQKIKSLFGNYEFGSLIRMLPQLESLFCFSPSSNCLPGSINTFEQPKIKKAKAEQKLTDINTLKSVAEKSSQVGIKLFENSLVIAADGYVCQFIPSESKEIAAAEELLENSSITKCGYEIKQIINFLKQYRINLKGYFADIELMHYLLMPERSHKIEILAKSYLDHEFDEDEDVQPRDLFSDSSHDNKAMLEKAFAEASLMVPLYEKLLPEIKSGDLLPLYETIEMPLIEVLADMEHQGIKIDRKMLAEYSLQLTEELNTTEISVREIAGDQSLNLSSPKQLGILLYEKLKLVKDAKKTSKKNYSTDEETLSELIDFHPVISKILDFRNLKKLLSTYIDPLPTLIQPDTGKIHTTYNQSLTATGRLSSVRPNLQNIPIRTERGREIRKAFVPSFENGLIMSADYSQIELRLMAHMSGDSLFIEAFRAGKDIHAATASKIFGVPEDQLTREQRNRAKVANFGIIYGISAFGLSQRLGIPRQEAKQLIEGYFSSYPQVENYMNQMIQSAKEIGYVTTLYGRKRYLPDINSKNPTVRGLAERNAVNAPIQGSAADIIKVAMIRVFEKISQNRLSSKMVLQVHDELVFDVYPGEEERLATIVKREMEGVIELSVPLTVDCRYGENWLEAH
ncbi:MAG: DNA polymerase I [Bacteroidetes bacterium GWE2_39_28]|nr:MAG: DNA polymerase I [Bacteroidetes bacterium GWE2_39_28]OFY12853.1 MAG: DNA polymerase I [Bacteroidetes bacterium GWF2_39_10]OFZ11051.1 MAG: DNA polymerase I [Bacteroidetes bacterium RIFOXYC2_FULL_39_11]HCT93751.1 DNA polymerase I [Rikenellaceae bacterium]